jgi:hypothetical protein
VLICQSSYIGFSFAGGYKSVYNEFGITFNSRLLNHIDFECGYAKGKFNGDGYCFGLSYAPINKRIQPFIGLQYLKNFGRKFDVSSNNYSTEFKTPTCEFLYGKIGIMYKLEMHETIVENMQGFFALTFSYRYTSYENFKLKYIGGYYPFADENYLNRRIGNGYGASLSLIILFGKQKSKSNSTL